MVVNKEHIKIVIQRHLLDVLQGYDFVKTPRCGAMHSFVGSIRDTDFRASKKDVVEKIKAIYYESYEAMAEKQISTIARAIIESYFPIDSEIRLYVAIRLGLVSVGEDSIVVWASSKRRHTSMDIVMSVLQQVKRSVVIWKKIIFCDGTEEWADSCKSEAEWLKHKEI